MSESTSYRVGGCAFCLREDVPIRSAQCADRMHHKSTQKCSVCAADERKRYCMDCKLAQTSERAQRVRLPRAF